MPGHVNGISAEVVLIMNSEDPMSYTSRDWQEIERALKGLKGQKLAAHLIKEVTVVSMGPTASSLTRHAHAATRRAAPRKRRR